MFYLLALDSQCIQVSVQEKHCLFTSISQCCQFFFFSLCDNFLAVNVLKWEKLKHSLDNK